MKEDRIAKGLYWDRSWKLVEGCTPLSEGCDHCWSARETRRLARHPNPKISGPKRTLVHPFSGKFCGRIRLREDNLELPLHVKKPTVWAIWNDLFHEGVRESFIEYVYEVIYKCKQHTFLLLTKRIDRMLDFHTKSAFLLNAPFENLWPGVTAENQARADERIPVLFQIPAAHYWLSIEPMLGSMDINLYLSVRNRFLGCGVSVLDPEVEGIVLGGESGPGARPMHPDRVRSVRDQCQAAGVPFFFKQWGEWRARNTLDSFPAVVMENFFEDRLLYLRVGKNKAGRLLDGRTWDDLPWEKSR